MNATILITLDGSPTLSLVGNGETYHSKHGALAESNHVFIKQGLEYSHALGGNDMFVFEMGFGTGLNAALTLLKSTGWKQKITYHSLELYPPPHELIRSCADHYAPEIREALLAVNNAAWNETVTINSYFSLIKKNTDFLEWQPSDIYQVVYYDAFSPSTAPHLWTVDCFRKLASAMAPGAALTTYCAKADVKRAMRACGFLVERLLGAPGKLEMTRAIRL